MAFDFTGLNAANLATFGRSVTYTPAGEDAEPATVTAILTGNDGEPVSPGNVAGLFLGLSAVPNIARGDEFEINSVTYRAEDPDPDDAGGVKVKLRKTS